MTSEVKDAARAAEGNPAVRVLARVGNAAIGLIHILIGGLAVSIALGSHGEADQSGAFRALVQTPGGIVVVWVVVVGLVALGAWQVLQTVVVRESDAKKRWAKRAVEASKAVVYFALAGLGTVIAFGGRASSSSSSRSASAALLAAPGGVFLLGLIGLVVVAIGVGFVVRGATRRFALDIRLPPGAAGTLTLTLGVVGYIAKGIALAIVGVLLLAAAVTYDAAKAAGLDGALTTVRGLPFGDVLLLAVAIGLIAYGVFWCVRAVVVRL